MQRPLGLTGYAGSDWAAAYAKLGYEQGAAIRCMSSWLRRIEVGSGEDALSQRGNELPGSRSYGGQTTQAEHADAISFRRHHRL